jgi:hypothetical protein
VKRKIEQPIGRWVDRPLRPRRLHRLPELVEHLVFSDHGRVKPDRDSGRVDGGIAVEKHLDAGMRGNDRLERGRGVATAE